MFRRERVITQNIGTGLVYKFRIYIETTEIAAQGTESPIAYTTITIKNDPNITIENTNISSQIKPVTITLDYYGPVYMHGNYDKQFSKNFTVTADVDSEGMDVTLAELILRDFENVMYVMDNDNIRNYLNIYLNPSEDSVFRYNYVLDYDYNYDAYDGSGGGDPGGGSGDDDTEKPKIYFTSSPDPGEATTYLLINTNSPVASNIIIIVEESNDIYFESEDIIIDNHLFYKGWTETEIVPSQRKYIRFVGIDPTSDDTYDYIVSIDA